MRASAMLAILMLIQTILGRLYGHLLARYVRQLVLRIQRLW
jgi:hypothetical protein